MTPLGAVHEVSWGITPPKQLSAAPGPLGIHWLQHPLAPAPKALPSSECLKPSAQSSLADGIQPREASNPPQGWVVGVETVFAPPQASPSSSAAGSGAAKGQEGAVPVNKLQTPPSWHPSHQPINPPNHPPACHRRPPPTASTPDLTLPPLQGPCCPVCLAVPSTTLCGPPSRPSPVPTNRTSRRHQWLTLGTWPLP